MSASPASASKFNHRPAGMAQRVAAFDWAATPLGPMDAWPQSLRIAVDICLHSRFPMFVWWGREFINIYNDAYVPMLGQRHPAGSGTRPIAAAEDNAIRGMRVLVVDDDPDARDLVKRLLEDRGASVTTAGSSAEALLLMGDMRFDVLVSDIGMPVEDGHSLMRQVRALPAALGGDIPAIALTAYARPEDREKAIRAGFQRHATKPVEPAELVALVSLLGGRPARPGDTPSRTPGKSHLAG